MAVKPPVGLALGEAEGAADGASLGLALGIVVLEVPQRTRDILIELSFQCSSTKRASSSSTFFLATTAYSSAFLFSFANSSMSHLLWKMAKTTIFTPNQRMDDVDDIMTWLQNGKDDSDDPTG